MAAPDAKRASQRTGFVLLPGASLGPWIWDDVIPHLSAPALALDLPGSETPETRKGFTLEAGVAATVQRIEAWGSRDVVLVGHSIGGMLAAGVASRSPQRVRRVVFLGSMLPDEGVSHLGMTPPVARWAVGALLRLKPTGSLPPESALRKEYCNDLDAAATQRVLANARPSPPRLFLDPVTWDVRRLPVPALYVKLLRDQSVPPQVQDRMASKLAGADVATLDTGHCPMLGRPKELAHVLNGVLA